jgi:integrase
MSIYKRGSIWWACYAGPDGIVRESTQQTDKRLAESFERSRRKQVKDGTWQPGGRAGRTTIAAYAERWIERQKGRGLATARDMETRLRTYVLPALGTMAIDEVRPRHVIAFVEELIAARHLSPRSVHHVYDVLRGLYRDAQIAELVIASPCVLPPGTLPKKRDKVPGWRAGALFTRPEIEQLISDERVPLDRRTYYALLFFGGLRHGEGAGRRWRDYDPVAGPLGRLVVATQYDGKELKTENPRVVPVHPVLAALLAEWKLSGFGTYFGRSPRPDDWLVPSRRGKHRTVRHTLRRLHEDLERLGLRERRTHDLRRTFVTLARADGADRDVLRVITHGPPSDVIDLYTSWPWATLCAAVSCLRIGRLGGPVAEVHNGVHTCEDGTKKPLLSQGLQWRSGRDSKP